MADDDANFVFTEWVDACNLSKKTVQTLRKEECMNKATLKLLTSRDVNKMDLAVGQARLLRVALQGVGNTISVDDEPQTKTTSGGGGTSNDPDDPNVILEEAGGELERILQAGGAGSAEAAEAQFPLEVGTQRGGHGRGDGYCDPLMILTVKSSAKKAHQILNYLPETTKARINRRKREQFSLATTSDGAITLKTEEQGTYYISFDEWSGANMRLGAELLKQGELKLGEIVYYMAYTAMISDLAARYEWMSILEFDKRYRELQAAHGFPWGTDHPHTERHVLIPRRPAPPNKPKVGGWSKKGGHGEDATQEKPLCRDYLSRNGCNYGPNCRFRHVRPATATGAGDKDPPKNE